MFREYTRESRILSMVFLLPQLPTTVSVKICSRIVSAVEGKSNQMNMTSDHRGLAIVIMGVSGSGKSTVGEMLAKAMGCSFLDADDFHSAANKEKMGKGIPLSDEDRIPWLETLRDTIQDHMVSRKTVVLGCSALQKKYREIIRTADSDYKMGSYRVCGMKFVCLWAPVEVIAARLERRAKEGKHFMPSSLLQSQLDLLQIDDAEGVIRVDATLSPESIVAEIQAMINSLMNMKSIECC